MKRFIFAALFVLFCGSFLNADETLLYDFDGGTYEPWTVEGDAFGAKPAEGTLPNQMEVSGYEGTGLVNSYGGGDKQVGKMISPEFTIDRPYISFLIGGGGFEETVYTSLYVEGKEVFHATGWNITSGGSEALRPVWFNLSQYLGKQAHLEIVDNATGGWGHLNVDSFRLTDAKPAGVEISSTVRVEKVRTFSTEKPFLLIPTAKEGTVYEVRVEAEGGPISFLRMRLPNEGEPAFLTGTLPTAPWAGKTIRITAPRVPETCDALDRIEESDKPAEFDAKYNEPYRPQFHFSPRVGWTNDPNGLFCYNGVYHLFYQHNPFSTGWGNMTWGHAVSTDLFHWREQCDAVLPDVHGSIFSGSAVVDEKNTSGLAPAGNAYPPIVLFFTSYGPESVPPRPVTQSAAYSLDGGKTWTKYAKNPILPNVAGANRDPKVFRYEPTNDWMMALYIDGETYALFRSKNLLDWTEVCRIEDLGCSECPDMFELPVDGDTNRMKWVFWGGNGNYVIGTFDGEKFTKEEGPFRTLRGGNDYAAQSYFDLPDGRRVQFGWMNGGSYPDMKFNQQFTLPRELTLRTTPAGTRLVFAPVKELESLRRETAVSIDAAPVQKSCEYAVPELFDAEITLDVSRAEKVCVTFADPKQTLVYDASTGLLNESVKFWPVDGKIKFRLVADRASWELFADRSEFSAASDADPKEDAICKAAFCFVPTGEKAPLCIKAEGGEVGVESIRVWRVEKSMGAE